MKNTKWIRRLRLLILSAVIVAIIIGIGTKTNLGTLCSLCPLGFLQISLASKSIAWGMLWPVILVLIAAIFVGKAFCAWICPTTWIKEIFKGKKNTATKTTDSPILRKNHRTCLDKKSRKNGGYYGYSLLIGALVASFIVGFPVFCLICPIGLFFGFIYAIYRLSVLYTPGWELIIFPTIFILEIFVLRSWCKSFCPIGTLFRLCGKITPYRLKPVLNKSVCIDCQACQEACPEHIDPLQGTKAEMEDCTLCLACYAACPTQSVQISTRNKEEKFSAISEDSPNKRL